MIPTACSEITEQTVRVFTMIAFSYLLLPRGLTHAAAGASMGLGPVLSAAWWYCRFSTCG